MDRIETPIQSYHLSEPLGQRTFRFLFTWLEQTDSAIHPEHRLAIWALVNIAHQFWLEAQHQELKSTLVALQKYLEDHPHLNQPLQSAQAERENCSSELSALCQKVDEAQEAEEDWDSEGALPTTKASIEAAKDLLCSAFMEARRKCIYWKIPDVSPGVDGGIHLYWKVGRLRLLLMVRANQQNAIEYVVQGPGVASSGLISVDAAVQRVLKALSEG